MYLLLFILDTSARKLFPKEENDAVTNISDEVGKGGGVKDLSLENLNENSPKTGLDPVEDSIVNDILLDSRSLLA